jgi:hypothetical protein
MDEIKEILSDFSIVRNKKELKGCLLHIVRLLERENKDQYLNVCNWIKEGVDRINKYDKEIRNIILMSVSYKLEIK